MDLFIDATPRQTVKLHLEDIRTIFDLHLGMAKGWEENTWKKLGIRFFLANVLYISAVVQDFCSGQVGCLQDGICSYLFMLLQLWMRSYLKLGGKVVGYEDYCVKCLFKNPLTKDFLPAIRILVVYLTRRLSHQEFFGSMASAKYLVLSSERNVKKSLEIRLSKTSQEHLQI